MFTCSLSRSPPRACVAPSARHIAGTRGGSTSGRAGEGTYRSRGQALLLVCLPPRPWRPFQEPGEVLVFPGVEKCREPFLDKVRASWTPQSVLGGSPVASLPPQPHGPSR